MDKKTVQKVVVHDLAAEAAMLAKCEAAARDVAEQGSAKLKLPFVVHPNCITAWSHREIRRLHAHVDDGEVLPSPISHFDLGPGEMYADVCRRRGTLRLWTQSIWNSPLYVYRDRWDLAIKAYAAARVDAAKTLATESAVDRRLALETFAAMRRTSVHCAPNGLVVIQTDLPWPLKLDI
jgi:hypothetical protein